MNNKELDIMRVENRKVLEIKLNQLQTMEYESSVKEEKVIDLLVCELQKHGKDANQIRQISQISKVIGQSLGFSTEYCNILENAAKIYDIGNIAIASEIYEKDDKLSFEEFEKVKYHTTLGYDILICLDYVSTNLGAIISKEHHEWWNGTGYPSQIKSEEINIASRIVAIADTMGALFRKRPGRLACSYDKILEYIENRKGIQFDPTIVEVVLINQKVIHEILVTDLEDVPCSWYA
jgi:response regulator RpfG family c-di-GMP phosphodiesterase